MKLSALFTLACASGALAAKEVVYLSNCYQTCQDGSAPNSYSEMQYYKDVSKSHNGQWPDDYTYYVYSASQSSEDDITWEGQKVSGQFLGSRGYFYSYINGGAQKYPTGQFSGTGRNSYNKGFNCFKDNYQQLYSRSPTMSGLACTATCWKLYYCFNNGT